MERRTAIACVLAGLVLFSGCLGFLSDPLTFSAKKVTVEDGALQESDYEEVAVETREAERTFSGKDVVVTNWVAQYEKRVSVLGMERRAAVFSAFSSPEVSVVGQSFNPLADYSNRDLVNLVQEQYGSLSDVQHVSNESMSMLGHETEVAKFSATAQLSGGSTVDVYIHVTKVSDAGDVVVAVGVYPQALEGEQEHVYALIQNLEHATE